MTYLAQAQTGAATNGIRLGWLDTSATRRVVDFVDEYLPLFSVNDTTAVYYSVGQNLYTPHNILPEIPDPKDRPYAAFLYGSVGMATIVENHLDSIELTAGVVGPLATGESTQKFVHSLIDGDNPAGWDHQLRNEPGLMISTQRLGRKPIPPRSGIYIFVHRPMSAAP